MTGKSSDSKLSDNASKYPTIGMQNYSNQKQVYLAQLSSKSKMELSYCLSLRSVFSDFINNSNWTTFLILSGNETSHESSSCEIVISLSTIYEEGEQTNDQDIVKKTGTKSRLRQFFRQYFGGCGARETKEI